MSLLIGLDTFGIPPKIAEVFDTLLAAVQTWAGKIDGFGKWVDVPYDAKYFSSSAGTWTVERGDVMAFQYTVLQDLMLLRIDLTDTSTSSVTN